MRDPVTIDHRRLDRHAHPRMVQPQVENIHAQRSRSFVGCPHLFDVAQIRHQKSPAKPLASAMGSCACGIDDVLVLDIGLNEFQG